MKQLALALPTRPDASFDNFVPASNLNCLLYLQEQSELIMLPEHQHSPVFLWGGGGVGKTHLLNAVANAVQTHGATVAWLTPQSKPSEDLIANVFLLDDCEQFSTEQQAYAFKAFIHAQTFGSWIVASAAFPPVDLQVREDLRTRLGWGEIFALKPLTEEELQAALWHAFRSRGLELSPAVQSYLLNHFGRDMSSLMGLLGQLDHYALASKRAITVPLIKRMLEDKEYTF